MIKVTWGNKIMVTNILQYKYHIESFKIDIILFIIEFTTTIDDGELTYPNIYNELKSIKLDKLEVDYLEKSVKKLDTIYNKLFDSKININTINNYEWIRNEENKSKLDRYELQLMRSSKLKRILKDENK